MNPKTGTGCQPFKNFLPPSQQKVVAKQLDDLYSCPVVQETCRLKPIRLDSNNTITAAPSGQQVGSKSGPNYLPAV